MLKPPAATQESDNESDDDSYRQDGGGNHRYGNRPLKKKSGKHVVIELDKTRIGSR